MKHTTKLLIVIATAISTVAFAGVGWAFWSGMGTGTGSAGVATLNPPTGVTANSTAGSSPVGLSWTAPTGAVAATGYYVQRYAGTTPSDACGTSPTALAAASAVGCSDTGVADGTYTYKVTAVFRSWTASNTSGSVTVTAANKLVFTTFPSGNQTASATATIGYKVQKQTSAGTPITTGSAVTLSLSTTSPGTTGKTPFFSATLGAASPSTVTIALNSSTSNTFYYSDTKAGTPTLTAQASGFADGTTSPTIVAATVNKLAFTTVPSGNQTASATATIGAYQVQEQDVFGNPVTAAGSAVTVNLTSTSTGTKFFSATSGGSAATSVPIAIGQTTTASFYYSDTKAGGPTLTAQASGITNNATTTPAIVAGTFAKYGVGVAASAMAGTSTPVTLSALDTYGNTVTSYTASNQTITWTGPAASPTGGTNPILPSGTVSFSAGLNTGSLTATLYHAGSQTLTATDASLRTGSATIAVDSRGVTLSMTPSAATSVPKNATTTFTITVPNDQYGNPFTSAAGVVVNLSLSGTQVGSWGFGAVGTATATVTITSGPATNTFAIAESGGNKTVTLTVTTSAPGFAAPGASTLSST